MQSRPNPLRGSRGGCPLHEFSFVTIFLALTHSLSHLSSSHLVEESGPVTFRVHYLAESSEVLDPFIQSASW